MRKTSYILFAMIMVVALLTGCRGKSSKKPPIHINPNMDSQERYNAQSRNDFYDDGRAMRLPVEGTIARGSLQADVVFHQGKDEKGEFITGYPSRIELTKESVERGRERYDIYCAVCHSKVGNGKGIVSIRTKWAVADVTDETRRGYSNGQLYDIIKNGVLTKNDQGEVIGVRMPGYASQITPEDRWYIVQYVRVLQKNADLNAGRE